MKRSKLTAAILLAVIAVSVIIGFYNFYPGWLTIESKYVTTYSPAGPHMEYNCRWIGVSTVLKIVEHYPQSGSYAYNKTVVNGDIVYIGMTFNSSAYTEVYYGRKLMVFHSDGAVNPPFFG